MGCSQHAGPTTVVGRTSAGKLSSFGGECSTHWAAPGLRKLFATRLSVIRRMVN